jgi:hypothetical protein
MVRRSRNHHPESDVWVLQRAGVPGTALLDELLETCGFWKDVAAHPGPVVIQPDLDAFEATPQACTDPALVEHLVDLLNDHGAPDVTVLDARSENDAWVHNREPGVVPELLGYRWTTPRKRNYAVADGRGGQAWREAALRISFAKNRTHEDCHFALGLHGLSGLAALRRGMAEDALAVLREAPAHWCLIDAVISAHGGAGQRAPKPLATHALFASRNTLAVDWAAAARMGLDPYASPVNALALRTLGAPRYRLHGDFTPWPLWRNVHPLLARSARARNRSEGVGAASAAWFQTVDRERFALRDFYSDRLNALLAPLLARVDDNPRAFWIAVCVNMLLARIDGIVRAQQTLFAKEKLRWRDAPLLMDAFAVPPTEYEGIESGLAAYESLLAHLPPARNGLRWRHVGGAILFSNEHEFPIPYRRFVRRVDIARAIQYMNDYIGGSTVAVRRDPRGRPVHQAERNLYLQQPNWMVLLGGEVIDVEKIQCIRREAGSQSIHWRTMASPNDSARIDDGCVSFTRTADGHTRVRVFARQQFALPPVLRVLDIDMVPALRDPIIEAAYTTFFEGTIANLQAACEGREFRIGRAPQDQDPRRALPRFLATAAAAVAELLRERRGLAGLGELGARAGKLVAGDADGAAPELLGTDPLGFRHFAGPTGLAGARERDDALVAGLAWISREAPALVQGLAEAVHRDLEELANPGGAA